MVKRIYIAGPMRGIPLYNFPAFDNAAHMLSICEETSEFLAVSPADIDRGCGFDPNDLPEDWDWNYMHSSVGTLEEVIERDFRALRTCHAIYLLKGWEESTGARAEAALAEWMGLEVFYEQHGLPVKGNPPETEKPLPATKDSNPKDNVGSRKPGLSAVPCKPLYEAGIALTYGGKKYGTHNWRHIGVRASVYYDAAMRHLMAWWEGEDIDPIEKGGSGLPHIAHAIAGLMVYRDAELSGMATDDRPIATGSPYLHLEQVAGEICDRYPTPVPAYTEARKRLKS